MSSDSSVISTVVMMDGSIEQLVELYVQENKSGVRYGMPLMRI